jgi:hypothetical protein
MQRSIRGRVEALEQASHPGVRPVYRMFIGESEGQARARLGLPESLDVLFVQRVIVQPPTSH